MPQLNQFAVDFIRDLWLQLKQVPFLMKFTTKLHLNTTLTFSTLFLISIFMHLNDAASLPEPFYKRPIFFPSWRFISSFFFCLCSIFIMLLPLNFLMCFYIWCVVLHKMEIRCLFSWLFGSPKTHDEINQAN